MRRRGIAFLLAAGALCPSASTAQHRPARAEPMAWTGGLRQTPQGSEASLRPMALSLAVPGVGQHVLGQARKWVYLAVEAGGWALFVERRRAGGRLRDRYRDYAWERARLQQTSRVDGDFAYYEVLTHWARSGAYDRDGAAPGVQPELDASTYNGSVWSLATQIFMGGVSNLPETDPAYGNALSYYQDEAYGEAMLWDWSADPAGQAEFAGLLDASDGRFRQATTVLGVVIANHLLSAGDAFLSSNGGGVAARLRIVPGAVPNAAWTAVLQVTW